MKTYTILAACFLFAVSAGAVETDIHYTLGMSHPQTHLLEVEIAFRNVEPDSSLDLILPVWRPGRYIILDFPNGVQEFSAASAGTPVPWSKTDKATWHISTAGRPEITVRYKIYANEFGTRTRGLNDLHAFVDGSSVFMYAEQYRHRPVTLTVLPYKDWHVTTGLDSTINNTFSAPDYDYLIDCPLEIGNQKGFTFEVDGVPHILSIFGEGNWNADTLMRDISKIVKAEKDFWGAFPYKRYVFLIECMPDVGGGTEHINSTEIQLPPFVFKNRDSYQGFVLGTIAHEYFHTWNVKQLRPKGIHPYDFTKENYTRELWIAEGMTSYYADLFLVRAGFTPASNYVARLRWVVSSDRGRPGNAVESVADASFNAWIQYGKGDQQSYNAESDFYERGSMISMLLDLEVRQRTSNNFSLDTVMREMLRRFPLSGQGYTLADFSSVITEMTGWKCEQFFDDYIYGTKPLKWEEELSHAGLDVRCTDSTARAWVGISLYDANGITKVGSIVAGSPAYTSGLDVGDELLALNGFRIQSRTFSDRIGEMKPGDEVTLTVFQDDRLRSIPITLGSAPRTDFSVTQVHDPTDLQKSIFEGWLGTKWK